MKIDSWSKCDPNIKFKRLAHISSSDSNKALNGSTAFKKEAISE
jgi:hypothetical protein